MAGLNASGAVTHKDLKALVTRERLSDFLPYISYDAAARTYRTLDNNHGYLYEIEPVAFAGDGVVEAMKGLITIPFGDGATLQIILFADPFIGNVLGSFLAAKTREGALVAKNAVTFVKHIADNQSGMGQLYGIPIRNFRVFVAVKNPKPLEQDVVSVLEEALKRFGVRRVAAAGDLGLLALMRRFFSDMREARAGVIGGARLLLCEGVDAVAPVSFDGNVVRFGAHVGRCLTPQAMAPHLTPQMANRLAGGMMGLMDDPEQITGPFLISLNITFGDVAAEIAAKSQIVSAQRARGEVGALRARHSNDLGVRVFGRRSARQCGARPATLRDARLCAPGRELSYKAALHRLAPLRPLFDGRQSQDARPRFYHAGVVRSGPCPGPGRLQGLGPARPGLHRAQGSDRRVRSFRSAP
jgi:conjugal transfer ATP-binding protein TraC